jgi:opacity protein-like surface antigen
MKKLQIAAALIAALAAPSAFAQATDRTGFFIEGRGGSASVSEDEFDDTTTAFQFNGGYRWGAIGIEGGYATFNDFEDNFNGLNINAALDGFTLGINGRYNFTPQWYLAGRVGAFFWDADANTAVCVVAGTNRVCTLAEADTDGTDFYAGASVGYDFNEMFSMGVAYDYFGADGDDVTLDTNVFSLTGEVRF